MIEKAPPPKVLTSLFGYGVYFPARIVTNGLKAASFDSDILIIEDLFTNDKRKTFEESRKAFGKNYRLAKLATKLSIDSKEMFNPEKVETLFTKWKEEQVCHFLCFSGLWLSILSLYSKRNNSIQVNLCRLDAGEAVTWRNNDNVEINKTYSFLDLKEKKINYRLEIPTLNYTPYHKRESSVVIHGGGWGLGYFVETSELLPENITKKVLIKDISQYDSSKPNTTYYMNDPSWSLNEKTRTSSNFPKLGKIISRDNVSFIKNKDYHNSLDLIINCRAIISKPGGMTIADSIITETPLIYLDALGENEEGNQRLIEHLKIGTSFEKWRKEKFSSQMLLELHNNIEIIKNDIPGLVSKLISDIKIKKQ